MRHLLIQDKKAAAMWISWVLILAFMVVLGVIIQAWSDSFVKTNVNNLQEIADTSECSYVGLSIDSVCQDELMLVINITNRNDFKIDQISLNVYDIYLENIQSKKKNITLLPGETQTVSMIKQGTTRLIELTPVFITENNIVTCTEKTIASDNIGFC
ncbi:MAG: hypothetical protein ACLFUO_03885 [Candidatus Woesearchaeota archaeon]